MLSFDAGLTLHHPWWGGGVLQSYFGLFNGGCLPIICFQGCLEEPLKFLALGLKLHHQKYEYLSNH
jgi:hypothetical protein